jgi:hypothetical protein
MQAGFEVASHASLPSNLQDGDKEDADDEGDDQENGEEKTEEEREDGEDGKEEQESGKDGEEAAKEEVRPGLCVESRKDVGIDVAFLQGLVGGHEPAAC